MPAHAQSTGTAGFEIDIPKSTIGLHCVGSSGIAVGTSGICDLAHVVSDDIHADEPLVAYGVTGDAEFTVDSSSTCTKYATPSPGCSIVIKFTPTSVGVKSATLSLTGSGNNVYTVPISGEGLAHTSSCMQTETPTCFRNDGTQVDNSFCGGSSAPVSQACTSTTCGNSCTTGLGAGRFIDLGRICSGKGGCITFYPIYGITDKLGNSCGQCSTRTTLHEPCPVASAATSCGLTYSVSKRECTYYNVNNTTSTTTFNSTETLATNCIYTLADSSGATCSTCEATWITTSGGGTNPVGTPTSNNTCPFTAY